MTLEEAKEAFKQPVRDCTAEEALVTLKAERFARWQSEMTAKEYAEITAAHEFCIRMLAKMVRKKDSEITWRKTGEDSYESSCGRFKIFYTAAPVNGGHWQLVDGKADNYFAAISAYDSFLEAHEAANKLAMED